MATLERLTVGQVLWDVRGRDRWDGRPNVYPITVKEIDLQGKRVLASWNGNPPRWVSARKVPRWRVKRPDATPKR